MGRFSATDAFYLEAGPQVGLLLSSKEQVEDVSADSESYNDLDFGVNIGAGYQLPAGVSIEARYHFGLANIMADSSEEGTDDFSVTNRVFSVGIGYAF